MFQGYGKLSINNKKYQYIYCDIYGLLLFIDNDINYKKSLITRLSIRPNNKDIYNLVIENYRNEERGSKVLYLIIYNEKDIVSTSRIFYKNKGYITFVYTHKSYRGKKLCQYNIKKLLELSIEKLKIKKYHLEVEKDNKPAIKCYLKCDFKIIKKNKDFYLMEYKI